MSLAHADHVIAAIDRRTQDNVVAFKLRERAFDELHGHAGAVRADDDHRTCAVNECVVDRTGQSLSKVTLLLRAELDVAAEPPRHDRRGARWSIVNHEAAVSHPAGDIQCVLGQSPIYAEGATVAGVSGQPRLEASELRRADEDNQPSAG